MSHVLSKTEGSTLCIYIIKRPFFTLKTFKMILKYSIKSENYVEDHKKVLKIL